MGSPRGNRVKIGMVMLTFNRLGFTKIVIENYFKATKVPHKLLVWDNHSTDGSRAWLDRVARKKYPLRVHLCNRNIGVPEAIRGALRHPFFRDQELFGKIDNDILVCDNWLENFVDAFKKIPQLGVIGAYNIRNKPRSWQNISGVEVNPAKHGLLGSLWLAKRSIFKKYPFVENGYAGNWIYFGRLGSKYGVLLAYHKKVRFETDARQWGGPNPFPNFDYKAYYSQIAKYRSYRHPGFLPK